VTTNLGVCQRRAQWTVAAAAQVLNRGLQSVEAAEQLSGEVTPSCRILAA